ncbi:peptidase C14 [Cellulosimicrobium cellulans]|uniref:peptidase C14 n=1 Tax=Cellulosimicrobium cellulans TaxID=1710 RepID=UPI0038297404
MSTPRSQTRPASPTLGQPEPAVDAPPPSRRSLLRVAGIASLAAGAVALGTGSAHATPLAGAPLGAKNDDKPDAEVLVAATVAELTGWKAKKVDDGAVAQLLGHAAAGDGAARLVRYDAKSTAAPNGGTVLAPADATTTGRWHTLHTGTADFRWFGLFGPENPADAALDALVDDPSITRIEAHTDLNFTRRHTFTRSNLELDFGGNTVTSEGIERNAHDNPFGAVLFFQGRVTDETQQRTLAATLPDLADVFEVADAGAFAVGQWWALRSDERPGGGGDERELQRLVQVTQVLDATHVRVDYKNGWELPAGRVLTWTRVEPVEQVHVRAMTFHGSGPFDGPANGELPDDREMTGSHPVAFEYAVRCDVSDVHGHRTWWPVIMRRWNTHFVTERCSVANPPTVFYGGAGYLTQQIYCLYGRVSDCTSHNARHLNDLTASAYCLVENCHGDGDDQGGNPFTTHGQYEHDLVFVGNSGLMDIANSGGQWGTAAKRITVKHHTCSWFVAGTKITDLTLEDVHVVARSTFDPQATLTINADGAQVRGCTAGFFAVGQRSSLSRRPTVVEDCAFALPAGSVLHQTPVTNPVHFVRTRITGVDGTILRGAGPVTFTDCELVGGTDDAPADPVDLGSADVTVTGGSWRGAGVRLSGARDQRLVLDGVRAAGTTTAGALVSRGTGAGAVDVTLRGADLRATDDTAHVALRAGDRYAATGSRFTGGRLDLPDGVRVLHARNVETGVDRTGLTTSGDGVLVDANLVV